MGKAGVGLPLADPKDLETCIQKLDGFRGLKADKKQLRHPRVIIFNPAINRNISLGALNREVSESNPQHTAGINGSLVTNLHWRGPHLVVAVCPSLFQRMFALPTKRIILNRLLVRFDFAHESWAMT